MAAIAYLEAYRRQLDLINTVEQLYGDLLDWQWSHKVPGVQAQSELNQEFFAGPKADALRLRIENPPTTAVGGFKGIVAIAANRGFNEASNAQEIAFRATLEGNREFCESFFDAAGHLTQEIPWWESVARFCHAIIRDAGPLSRGQLWDWAAANQCVAAVDLVSFHSPKDGVTSLIRKESRINNQRADLKRALRNAAKSTFRMVLRLHPKVVFIASAAGAEIAEEVLNELPNIQSQHLHCSKATSDWGHELGYRLRWHRVKKTHVITMPHQLFSGQAGIIRKLQVPIAHELRRIFLG